MATILDVGGYVYRKLGWVDAWTLEKLTYFAQAWHLAWDGRPLFDEPFEAWRDGPVSPLLHRVNKYDRSSHLSTELPGSNPDALDPAAQAIVDAVLGYYGKMPRQELIDLSHEVPWRNARGNVGDHSKCDGELALSDIRKHYSGQAVVARDACPKAPAFQPLVVAGGPAYSAAAAAEIDRWRDTLAWLAER